MSRLLRFAATAATLVLLTGIGCQKKNTAPESPSVRGPTSARPTDTLTYRFSSVDPDGDSVHYMISWGDGAVSAWSPASPSGEDYIQTHAYTDSVTYYVKARAKDGQDAESEWSDSLRVTIGLFPPDAPGRPIGLTSCSTGVAYSFKTKANHPLNDSVSIQFYWGFGPGDTSGWGPMVKSNTYYEELHTWSLPGTYKIAARARDAAGFESPWSESLVVTVDTLHGTPRGAPHGLVLSAPTDSTVKVTWLAPAEGVPLRYNVSFKEVGTTNFDSLYDTTGLGFVHYPGYRTGQYRVTAVYDTNRVVSTETPSTTPIMNDLRYIPELSAAGDTGYWWNRTTGEAFLYTMDTLANVDSVDFYITDRKPGFAGPDYFVASPDSAPLDPGGHVSPAGYWHDTWFSHLDSTATDDSILPRFIPTRYRPTSLLDSLPRLLACYTWDSHYALLDAQNVDTVRGEAYIRTWFQLIPNLRLMEH